MFTDNQDVKHFSHKNITPVNACCSIPPVCSGTIKYYFAVFVKNISKHDCTIYDRPISLNKGNLCSVCTVLGQAFIAHRFKNGGWNSSIDRTIFNNFLWIQNDSVMCLHFFLSGISIILHWKKVSPSDFFFPQQ